MTNLITPPLKLVKQWCLAAEENHAPTVAYSLITLFATCAAQWGADQELEACLAEVSFLGSASLASKVRAARRPPPSLKEQSIALLDRIQAAKEAWDISELDIIRRALETLDD